MKTVSIKVSEALLRRIRAVAKSRRISKSALIRECVESALRTRKTVSCLDLMGDAVGSLKGAPRDLSTNKEYLRRAVLDDAS